jgi:nitroimidazol reductase NimA-like FMN-containing flavoprotein (pyridoxamine 5'-phosphate oxidase superfamily)
VTTDNAAWSLLDRGGRLETLDRDECRRLLGSTNVGRIGYCTDLGPRIVPLNYTLVGEAVTFRTGIDTEASHQLFDHPVAFEVDQFDEFLQTGWSVLVVGNAQPLDEESLLLLDVRQTPQPWPAGRRVLVVQLPLTMMTGRRVHPS